jgi:hypothetical protein
MYWQYLYEYCGQYSYTSIVVAKYKLCLYIFSFVGVVFYTTTHYGFVYLDLMERDWLYINKNGSTKTLHKHRNRVYEFKTPSLKTKETRKSFWNDVPSLMLCQTRNPTQINARFWSPRGNNWLTSIATTKHDIWGYNG